MANTKTVNPTGQTMEQIASQGLKNPDIGTYKPTTTTASTGKNISSLSTSQIQQTLNQSSGANLKVDNAYGLKTTEAVKQFQQANGLKVDGIVGPQTQAALLAKQNGGGATNATDTTTSPVSPPPSPEETKMKDAQARIDEINNTLDDAFEKFNTSMEGYINGSIPLTQGEQAQINSLTLQYQALIDQQKSINTGAIGTANIRGYQTGAAEYDPTFQAKTIGSIASAGIARVADLTTKMAGAIAELTEKFKENDMKAIKSVWDEYQEYSKQKNTELQKTIEDTQKAINDARDYALSVEKEKQDKYEFEQTMKQKAEQFAKNYALDQAKYKHTLEMDMATGINSLGDKSLDMLARGYLTSGVLPAVGYGKDAVKMRTAIINRAVVLSGGNDTVNPAVNKAMYDANKQTLAQQQKNYAVADTAFRIFDKNGTLAINLVQGLNKSNSPAINQLNNAVINQTTGQGQLDSFRAVITSLQAEYATLISVKGGSNGVTTEGDKAKAEKAIPMNITPVRLKQVLDNLKTEGRNVLQERQQTIDQLNENITKSSSTFNIESMNSKETFQSYYDSHPALHSQIDTLINENPTLTDEEVMEIIGQ